MRVLIPSPLLFYTNSQEIVAFGETLADLLTDMDRQFPGIRNRIVDEQGGLRPHMRIFVNGRQVRTIAIPLQRTDEVQLIQALSGG